MSTDTIDLPRVCAITGGSSGIGLATAMRFVAAGDHVAICARDPVRLAAAVERLRTHAADKVRVLSHSVDVSQMGAVTEFIHSVHGELSRLDVLVNNAGYPPCDSITQITRQQFEQAIAVNVAATFEGTQAAWPIMAEQRQGVIVNISSMAAIDPFPGFSVYGACKAWNELFTQATAAEGLEFGIRVSCVRPGAVSTPMLQKLFPDFPAEQMVTPEQVAQVIFQTCDLTTSPPGAPIPVVP
jgi:3-oxoacyl-[acyl-carrier protein] reductase